MRLTSGRDHEKLPTDFSWPIYASTMGRLAGVLRSLREDAALTQEDLADKAGLSARTISDIERGLRQRLYRDTAERLAVALGLAESASTDFVELARGRVEAERGLDVAFRRRFVAWHVDRIEALAESVGNEEQWFAVLDADESNLMVALRWASEGGDADSVLRLATGLFQYWQARGALTLGRQWLERGLSMSPAAAPPSRMAGLWAVAWLAFHQGDDAKVAQSAEELAILSSEFGDARSERNSATLAGISALAEGESVSAVERMKAALQFALELDQPRLLALSLLNLGIAQIGSKDSAAARNSIAEAIRIFAETGDERFRARSLGYLGLASLVDGDPQRAETLYAQSLTMFHELREGKGIAESLTGLATAAAIHGDGLRAALLAGAAERFRESFAGRAFPVECRLADATLAQARSEALSPAWDDAWTRGRALRNDEAVAEALDGPTL